jgi:hypothetical protein
MTNDEMTSLRVNDEMTESRAPVILSFRHQAAQRQGHLMTNDE